jgi:hypothetical protein
MRAMDAIVATRRRYRNVGVGDTLRRAQATDRCALDNAAGLGLGTRAPSQP